MHQLVKTPALVPACLETTEPHLPGPLFPRLFRLGFGQDEKDKGLDCVTTTPAHTQKILC